MIQRKSQHRFQRRFQRNGGKGFTLVELMVVIVILGIIGTMAFVFVLDKPDQAKWEAARSDMAQIQQALSHYRIENGDYPDDLSVLGGQGKAFPNGVPKDPWTKDFFEYYLTETGFELVCYGKDQTEGGTEIPNRDIYFNEAGEIKEE